MKFDRGYLSPYFITNRPRKMTAELEDALRAAAREEVVRACKPCCRCSKRWVQSGKPLLIIAEDVEGRGAGPRWSSIVCRGGLKVAAVKAPGFGDRRKAMLEGHRDP